jgi:hypothetical protein
MLDRSNRWKRTVLRRTAGPQMRSADRAEPFLNS